MPCLRSLIILSVDPDNTSHITITSPSASKLALHKFMYASQNMTTKHAMRYRHQTCAIVNELSDPRLEVRKGSIPQPLRDGIIHCVYLALNS